MKSIIDYSELDVIDQHNQAIKDCKDWLGDSFESLTQELKKATNFKEFSFYLSFAGIEGYPVKALYNYVHGLQDNDSMTIKFIRPPIIKPRYYLFVFLSNGSIKIQGDDRDNLENLRKRVISKIEYSLN